MSTKHPRFPSIFRCCVNANGNENDVYIKKFKTKNVFIEGNKTLKLERTAEMSFLEFDEDEDEHGFVGYARIMKTPEKERRVKLRPDSLSTGKSYDEENANEQYESLFVKNRISIERPKSPIPAQQQQQEMAMTANARTFPNGTTPRSGTNGFRIEDVTDDPRYKDYGTNKEDDGHFEEGALVEYCRSKVVKPSAVLKQPPQIVRRPSSTVPTSNPEIKSNIFGFGKTKTAQGITAPRYATKSSLPGNIGDKNGAQKTNILPLHGRKNWNAGSKQQPKSTPTKLISSGSPSHGSTAQLRSNNSSLVSVGTGSGGRQIGKSDSKPQMAHVIDVEVGQPCSKMAVCNCYGFRPHSWRKVCVHCKCDRSDHEIGPNQALNIYERLGIKPSVEMAKVMQQQKQQAQRNNSNDLATIGSVGHGYAWVPPGISRIKVEEYMSQLPNHMIPRLNNIGEKNREKQLMVQLPRQDLSIAYCKHLKTPQERRLYEEFVNARNEVALDIGYVNANIQKSMECRKCRGIIERNEMAVIAPKLGETTGWHSACFNCQTCEQLLVDLTYCVRDEKVFCERHFAELHKPRCAACDELIFAAEYTKAMNKDWHSDHFCCWQCDGQLTGQRYILRDDHPYCIKCYEEIFANVCDECQKHIGIDSKDLSYKDKHWHEECFLCTMCKISLVDKPFGSKNDRIYCSNCYDQAFATRCDGCGEIFKAGMKKMEYKGKQWHDKCFVCANCKSPIGTRSFIPKNEEVFCATCYEEKFATRCCKCKKVINTGGVTYKNEPWHRECFCCTNCNTSLAGQRFTSKDEKPYCADCYGELFAKRCSACVKPITGIGGAKFISFEDRHWHNDCFVCSQCSLSLVGKGFITDGADILCAECAKARLMAANS